MVNQMETLPAIALRGTTILPGTIVHFDVSRERSIKAIEAAMLRDQKIFLVTQKDPETENPDVSDLYEIGTVAYIKQVVKLPKDLLRVLAEGTDRARLVEFGHREPWLEADVEVCEKEDVSRYPQPMQEAMVRSLKELFRQYCMQNGKISKDLVNQIMALEEIEELEQQIAANLPFNFRKKQRVLEAMTLDIRYEILAATLTNEIQVMEIGKDLQRKVKARIDKNQREYILREQMKQIREELGEDDVQGDAEKFRRQAEKLTVSDEVREKIYKEIDRYQHMNANSAEYTILRGYIETVLSLPWDKRSKDREDLQAAWKILDEGHYGLKDVKERVMEFLCVRRLTGKGKSPILCLVGPPGTGKTSIARSVAEALEKKYIRVCLGGVRDEAEIRGHRKTYVGAMPGRITVALQQAGTGNPLMLLDEIDKTSSDYKGDTSAALLEVLDPEQNSRFQDHYVEVPQDLSEVLFIATANDMHNIPRPLLDRMEILQISGYTQNEKEHIAKEHLIPKQMELNGLKEGQLEIKSAAVRDMINHYTKEAGVRSLEKNIGRICRKAVRSILEEGRTKVTVTSANLSRYLGKERYQYLMANEKPEIGIARGLAWTQAGGDTLQIEVNTMEGEGALVLTGQMGDVMKESARIGISYIRSIAGEYGISSQYFKERDLHIHIPEGAVPKDGPSAGITMATAMFSAIVKRPVRADLAMTGEVTLRGRVLPIGGLKEKLLAARYAGIKEVLVPKKNRPDIEEMEAEIRNGLQITYVENMKEVLEAALVKEEPETDGN